MVANFHRGRQFYIVYSLMLAPTRSFRRNHLLGLKAQRVVTILRSQSGMAVSSQSGYTGVTLHGLPETSTPWQYQRDFRCLRIQKASLITYSVFPAQFEQPYVKTNMFACTFIGRKKQFCWFLTAESPKRVWPSNSGKKRPSCAGRTPRPVRSTKVRGADITAVSCRGDTKGKKGATSAVS